MADSLPDPEIDSQSTWDWTPERALKTTFALGAAAMAAAFLALGGTFLFNPFFRNSPSPFEKVIGALMVLTSMALLVVAPLVIARLRRTTTWKLATVGGVVLAAWVGVAVFLGILTP